MKRLSVNHVAGFCSDCQGMYWANDRAPLHEGHASIVMPGGVGRWTVMLDGEEVGLRCVAVATGWGPNERGENGWCVLVSPDRVMCLSCGQRPAEQVWYSDNVVISCRSSLAAVS